jgi:hypothetical protein
VIEQLREGYLLFAPAHGSSSDCSFGYNKDYGDGANGSDSGGGYGDGTLFGDSEGDGDVPSPRVKFFLACPDPARFDCLVINVLCRMHP